MSVSIAINMDTVLTPIAAEHQYLLKLLRCVDARNVSQYLTFSDYLRRTIGCGGTNAYCIMYTSLGGVVISKSAQGN